MTLTPILAKAVKTRLSTSFEGKALTPLDQSYGPFRNPIAWKVKQEEIAFGKEEKAFIEKCQSSAKLAITDENYQILKEFFDDRKQVADILGKYYQTLSFDNFILRLFHNRYTEVYFGGRAVVLKDGEDVSRCMGDHTGITGRQFLRDVGTADDTQQHYKNYLTLEEAALSHLILPIATSIVIGTGSRSDTWDVKKELGESIDVSTFSYPAAAEFRDGSTAHYDLYFLTKPQNLDEYAKAEFQMQVALIKSNPALMKAARGIYGSKFAFEEDVATEFLSVDNKRFYLHKNAYLARTKNMLKTLLLANDQQMKEMGLGQTFQLKGLGLGAFSFTVSTPLIETMFRQALNEVLNDPTVILQHINCINLINLPSIREKADGTIVELPSVRNIRLIDSKMSQPTSKIHSQAIGTGEIGSVVICGDSGSKVGNEGNMGAQRSSSDDPASQYSLLNPTILDPDVNPALKEIKCVQVLKTKVAPDVTPIPSPPSAGTPIVSTATEQPKKINNSSPAGKSAVFGMLTSVLMIIAAQPLSWILSSGLIVAAVSYARGKLKLSAAVVEIPAEIATYLPAQREAYQHGLVVDKSITHKFGSYACPNDWRHWKEFDEGKAAAAKAKAKASP
jgi:hypothetical protein